MPSTIKIRVIQARDLPIMDKKSKLNDSFVTVKFGTGSKHTTEICKKTLNPVWKEDFRIEVNDDVALQDEAVEFK
jgi:Ca2+-dependent lipid-binding protein